MLTWGKLTIAVPVFLGILGLASAALFNGLMKEREQTNHEQVGVLQAVKIPQIDASAPTQTETATFSLG
jgi:hypothetical protein